MHKRVSARKAVLVRKTLRSRHTPLTITQHDSGLEMVVVQVALEQNRGLSVAGAYMPVPLQISQSLRRLLNRLPASAPLLFCEDSNAHRPQWESFLETPPSDVAVEFLQRCADAGFTLVDTPGEITHVRGRRKESWTDQTGSRHLAVSDWRANVSPLSDHHMLTFTLYQACVDSIPSAPPSVRRVLYSWGSASRSPSPTISTNTSQYTNIRSSQPT
ncbi:putative Endonuclease-reverse transcriptase [Trypanosoma cruzi]|uniref:Putative Endonuclease-reverse transcriptase n=1 Tax=Trypanosoma cruzi TaxID=5693 RepID=A0A2V2WSU1_TRYCR|nr:putative Endonuclease-reverse transcriptase [Trypanosoma cruzi]